MTKKSQEKKRKKTGRSYSLLVALNLQSRIINRSMKNGPPRATTSLFLAVSLCFSLTPPRFIVINFIIDSSSEEELRPAA